MVYQVIVFLLFMLAIPMRIKEHGESAKPKFWISPFLGQFIFLWLLWMGNFFIQIQLPQVLVLSAHGLGFIIYCWELATGYDRKVNAFILIISGIILQSVLFWGGFYSF